MVCLIYHTTNCLGVRLECANCLRKSPKCCMEVGLGCKMSANRDHPDEEWPRCKSSAEDTAGDSTATSHSTTACYQIPPKHNPA